MSAPRPARSEDIPQLKALWKLVFGDADELIDAFFALLWPDCRTAVVEENGTVVAAAYAVRLENIRYIYAVATHPEYRGRGYGEAVTLAAAAGDLKLLRHRFHRKLHHVPSSIKVLVATLK